MKRCAVCYKKMKPVKWTGPWTGLPYLIAPIHNSPLSKKKCLGSETEMKSLKLPKV